MQLRNQWRHYMVGVTQLMSVTLFFLKKLTLPGAVRSHPSP